MTPRWRTGDTCVLRFVGHDDGMVLGYPHIFVEARGEHVILYQPAGVRVANVKKFVGTRDAAIPRGTVGNGGSLPSEYFPPISIVRVLPRNAEHAVEVFLAADDPVPDHIPWLSQSGRIRGWKVNLQARLVEHDLGFDTTDNTLDVVMSADRKWRWKDEEQHERRVASGLTTAEESARFRAEGERVIDQIERRIWPFVDDWAQWQPNPAWGTPVLPAGWDELPGYDMDLNRARPA